MSRLYVGIDWATETHYACLMDENGAVKDHFPFSHAIDGIQKLFARIHALEPLDKVVFALERPDGLLVDTLLSRNAEVWYINAKQSEQFRQRYTAAGAKDDRRDAWVLAKTALTDADLYRRVQRRPEILVRLRACGRRHTELGDEVVRLVAKVRSSVAEYYPSFLKVSDDFQYDWVRTLWRWAPTPAAAEKLTVRKLEPLIKEKRVRKHTSGEIVAMLRADALVADQATVAVNVQLIAALLDMLEAAVRHWRSAERELEKLLDQLAGGVAPQASPAPSDWAVVATAVRSMPGVGSKIAAVLVGEAPEALRAGRYPELRALAGVAPVTDATGKRSKRNARVKMRRSANVHLRDQMHVWGRTAANADPHWKAYLQRLLSRGHTRARAYRQVADRLLAVLCAVVRNKTVYDPTRFTPLVVA